MALDLKRGPVTSRPSLHFLVVSASASPGARLLGLDLVQALRQNRTDVLTAVWEAQPSGDLIKPLKLPMGEAGFEAGGLAAFRTQGLL